MSRDTLHDMIDMFPGEFHDPPQMQPGRRTRPLQPSVQHISAGDTLLFLAKVTERKRRERKVMAQYPSEAEADKPPREATTFYYVNAYSWFRLYAADMAAGELRRLGDWDDKDVARQWLYAAANDPDMRVPATRPRLAD